MGNFPDAAREILTTSRNPAAATAAPDGRKGLCWHGRGELWENAQLNAFSKNEKGAPVMTPRTTQELFTAH